MNNYQPSGIIPGGCALLTFLIVIVAAFGIRIYDAASNYMNTPANTNSNTAQPTPTPSRYPASTASSPTPYSSNTNYGASNTYTTNSTPISNTTPYSTSNSNRSSRYTWRVKSEAELRSEPSESGESVETLYQNDGLILNYRKSETSKWYNVTTEAGNTGWIDGNFIEENTGF